MQKAPTLNVRRFVDEQPLGGYQAMVLGLCIIIVLMEGFDAQAMGFVAPVVSKQLHIARAALGTVLSSGLVGMMMGALALSPLADRIGRKPVIVASALLFGAASLLTATAHSLSSMVMLHGLGDSIEGYRWLPEAMNLPWLNYLLVNAPDDYYGGYAWFDLNDIVPGVQRSRKLLFELLDDLRARGFPAEQITFGGFSQGSLMAVEVGLRYPHRFAGVVCISGWVCEPEKLLQELPPVARQQRLLMTHGTG